MFVKICSISGILLILLLNYMYTLYLSNQAATNDKKKDHK